MNEPRQKNPAKVKAGRARARAFTPEYQRWAGSHQSSAARSEAGRKGALATIAKHGYPVLEQKIGSKYLTYIERRIVAVFNRWGWQREIDYWIDYRVDLDTTSYFLDFVFPGRRYLEVSSRWVAQQEKNVTRNARKRTDLQALGWRGLWLTESDTDETENLEALIQLWLEANPPAHREHAQRAMELLEEPIPF